MSLWFINLSEEGSTTQLNLKVYLITANLNKATLNFSEELISLSNLLRGANACTRYCKMGARLLFIRDVVLWIHVLNMGGLDKKVPGKSNILWTWFWNPKHAFCSYWKDQTWPQANTKHIEVNYIACPLWEKSCCFLGEKSNIWKADKENTTFWISN